MNCGSWWRASTRCTARAAGHGAGRGATADVAGQALRIRLVEGRIGEVRIQGNAGTDTAFVAERLFACAGQLVDLDRLEALLLRLQPQPGCATARRPAPGGGFGLTDLQVDVASRAADLRLSLDNQGSDTPAAGA